MKSDTNQNADATLHPDTIRLNHLIEMDRSVLNAALVDGKHVEVIEFIFDADPTLPPEEQVRAAIDQSIEATNAAMFSQAGKAIDLFVLGMQKAIRAFERVFSK